MRRFTLVLLALFLLPVACTGCLGHTRSAPDTDANVESTPADNRQRLAITQRLIEWNRLYRAALANPSAPHNELDAITTGPLLQRVRDQIRASADKSEHDVPGPLAQATFRVVKIDLIASGAVAIVCDVNDYWTVRDSDETPTDTGVFTTKLRFTLRFTNEWRPANASSLNKVVGIQACAA